jgi:hypothetical protein
MVSGLVELLCGVKRDARAPALAVSNLCSRVCAAFLVCALPSAVDVASAVPAVTPRTSTTARGAARPAANQPMMCRFLDATIGLPLRRRTLPATGCIRGLVRWIARMDARGGYFGDTSGYGGNTRVVGSSAGLLMRRDGGSLTDRSRNAVTQGLGESQRSTLRVCRSRLRSVTIENGPQRTFHPAARQD